MLPISYGDAQHFLAPLGGRVAPPNWRGSLPITYHVGGDEDALIHMAVKSDWSLKTIYNVIAVMKGSGYADRLDQGVRLMGDAGSVAQEQ